ncbi:hypothetical protein NQZ68_029392 [Dissostichus eleginoides]|nr:hypothetical protein NQZ68_029392 [Dissostichus eleginoides]
MATRWGICSTGRISHDFTVALKTLPHEDHQVVAVAARKLEDAQEFATKHSISRVYGSYEELARDPDIDVVYIGVYHPYRLMLFTNAKKNVLCEREVKEILSSAKRNDVFLMEMHCPFCGSSVTAPHGVCGVCGRDITFLVADKVPEEMPTTSAHLSAQPSTSAAGSSAVVSLYREIKKKIVKISVGVMRMKDGFLRPVRGRLLPLDVEPQWSCQELLAAAIKKQKAFNQVMEDGAHVLLYPDATEITNIPGTDIPFTVQMYRNASGKSYRRIALYICAVEDLENSCVEYCARQIRVLEDYSPEVMSQRVEYKDTMAELYKLGLKPALLFPAQLRLTLSGGGRKWIGSVEEAKKYIATLQKSSEPQK